MLGSPQSGHPMTPLHGGTATATATGGAAAAGTATASDGGSRATRRHSEAVLARHEQARQSYWRQHKTTSTFRPKELRQWHRDAGVDKRGYQPMRVHAAHARGGDAALHIAQGYQFQV